MVLKCPAGAYFDDMILRPRSSQILVFNTNAEKIEAVVRNFLVGPEKPLEVSFELGLDDRNKK